MTWNARRGGHAHVLDVFFDMQRPCPPIVATCVLALLVACSAGDGPVAPSSPLGAVQPRLSLVESAANATALPIGRIRLVSARVTDGAVLHEASVDVDPSAAEWSLDITIPGAEGVTVLVYVSLIHVTPEGIEVVQFSGRTAPVTIASGEAALPDVPIVRGPIDNLFATGVSIESAPAVMVEGETATLTGVVTTSEGTAPTVFWTSLDAARLTMDGPSATAVSPGTARVVASAGAFADTAVVTVVSSDMTGPQIEATSPAPGAVGVSAATTITATFDEPLEATSVSASTFTLVDSLGAPVPSSVTYSGVVATLTPDLALDTAHTYTATVSTGVRDFVGNPLGAEVSWSFTTAGSAILLSSFDAGLGRLVAIAFDPVAGTLFIQPDFDPLTAEFSTSGVAIGAGIPQPGLSSNDIDLDFADVPITVGQTSVPANTLLVINGEATPGTFFAVQKEDGLVLDSLTLPATGNPVGGAYHVERATFFSVGWNTDVITEVDLAAGTAVASFPVRPAGSPAFDVFFGDLEVDPSTGLLMIVSSSESSIRLLTPAGAFVRDIDVGLLGITSMSGIAWDAETRTAWVVSTTGMVYQVGGLGL